jgi:hypothetical protein
MCSGLSLISASCLVLEISCEDQGCHHSGFESGSQDTEDYVRTLVDFGHNSGISGFPRISGFSE